MQQTVIPSAAKTATFNSADFELPQDAVGGMFILSITAASGTLPTLDLKLQVKDEVSGAYTDLPGAAFAQKITTGNDTLSVYPGIFIIANRAVSSIMAKTMRMVATIGGTTPSFTFSVAVGYRR